MTVRSLLLLILPAACTWTFQVPPPDLRQAARLDQEGRCQESEPIYRQALAAATRSPALLNNAGNHYLACGDSAAAARYFEQLLHRIPQHPNANWQLARLAVNQKQKEKALLYLRVPAASDDPLLLNEAGSLYASLGEFKLAQQAFQRVVARKPGDFDALWDLGRAAARAGDLARAKETLDAALRLRPDDAGALFELGSAHAASGDFPRAVFLLAQAQNRAPDQPHIALALARAAEDAGYYGDAVVAFDRYLTLRPADDTVRRDRARVVASTPGRAAEGTKALEDYIAAHPRDPIARFQLAQLVWNADADKSLTHLAEAIRLDPRRASAHTARAWLLHRVGRDADALPHLEAALKLTPGDVRALDQYGLVLIALDREKEAEAAFRKAAALAPADWEVRLHLGRVLMEQGREQEARPFLDGYQKLRPARQRDPRREPGMIELATLPAAERRAREIERFRAMVQARLDDPLLRLHLGTLLLEDGREQDAATEFRALLSLNVEDATLAQAGRVLLDAGRYELALPFLNRAGRPVDRATALFHTAGAAEALPLLDHSPDALLLKARIFDSMGRTAETKQILAAGSWESAPPPLAAQAALLSAKYERYAEASRLLAKAAAAAPNNRHFLLSQAVVLALDNRISEAERRLKEMEDRWPEWDRPYRLHALLLSQSNKGAEAARKLRTAAALNPDGQAAACQNLRDWLLPACLGGEP